MVFAVRSLALSAALLLAAIAPTSHAFSARIGDVYEVPEADRISPKQLFARDTAIVDSGEGFMYLELRVPGRVYVRHVENETALAAGLYGRLRASGDTRGAVEYVSLSKSYEFGTFSVSDEHFPGPHNTSKSESLLVEIDLYQKNVVKKVDVMGSADVVVLQDVIYAAMDGRVLPYGTELNAHASGSEAENAHLANAGRLFVSDPKARWTSSGLSIITFYGAFDNAVQIDVASINSTEKELFVYAKASSNVTLFASEFVSSIFMINTTKDSRDVPRNPLCIATKVDVNLTAATILQGSEKWTIIPAESTCIKLPLPPCEPALIRDDIDAKSKHLNDAKTATPAPSSAFQLVHSGMIAALAVALIHLL